ncbi:MAG: Cof-type HAD-IIB family hydrolase [Negativicutes bacterium]|nr:Cof-type HAD-IIB family hydrolase [Negativicutes bacterium]MDR3591835.1 Cof-type HAD-IIB family hydrolase [Negativicutes bacterium]
MSIKLVAVDLDDTLLDNARKVSERTKVAIQKAVGQGVAVTLSTGRMHRSALPYALELALDIPLITYNGALIRSSLSNETLFHRPMAAETAAEVVELFRERGWFIQVYLDDVLYVKERDARARYYEEVAGIEAVAVGDRIYSLGGTPTKLLSVAEPEENARIRTVLAEVFGERLYATVSKPNYLEMANPSVNKGVALDFLAQRLGIDRTEIMAVGDSLNDMDMIEYAGWGVAMGNARAELKRVAQAVTGANDADGVAEAIEKYVLKPAGEK